MTPRGEVIPLPTTRVSLFVTTLSFLSFFYHAEANKQACGNYQRVHLLASHLNQLQEILPNLDLLCTKSSNLAHAVVHSSAFSEQVSRKVRKLDVKYRRVEAALKRVDALQSVKDSVEGANRCLRTNDVLGLVQHIQEFREVKESVPHNSQEYEMMGALEARAQAIVLQHFENAVASGDMARVNTYCADFFKALEMQDTGVTRYLEYVRVRLVGEMGVDIDALLDTDPRTLLKHVDHIQLMDQTFATAGRIFQEHETGLIREVFGSVGGPTKMYDLITSITDQTGAAILRHFLRANDLREASKMMSRTWAGVDEANQNQSRGPTDQEFEDVTNLLGELAFLLQQALQWIAFVQAKGNELTKWCQQNQPGSHRASAREDTKILTEMARIADELVGIYTVMETSLLTVGTRRAIDADDVSQEERNFDEDVQLHDDISSVAPGNHVGGVSSITSKGGLVDGGFTSTVVDEVFLMFKYSTERAIATCSNDALCAVLSSIDQMLSEKLRFIFLQRLEYKGVNNAADQLKQVHKMMGDGIGKGLEHLDSTLNRLDEQITDNIDKLQDQALKGMESIKDFLKVGQPRGIRRQFQFAGGGFDAQDGSSSASSDQEKSQKKDIIVRSVQDIEVVLNDIEKTAEYIKELRSSIDSSMQQKTSNSRLSICLDGLAHTSRQFLGDLQRGLRQLSEVLIPQIHGITTVLFSHRSIAVSVTTAVVKGQVPPSTPIVTYDLNETEYAVNEANDPFAHQLVHNLEELLEGFAFELTEGNYTELVLLVIEIVCERLETAIFQKRFSQLGAAQLDKDIRVLVTALSRKANRSVRDKFAKLTQMYMLLSLDSPREALDLWSPTRWRLSAEEVKKVLSLRKDFDHSVITQMVLH
jgi:hypothetical protein